MGISKRRPVLLLVAAATAASQLLTQVGAAPREGTQTTPAPGQTQAQASPMGNIPAGLGLALKVRRLPSAVELVIEGTGSSPELVESSSSYGWQGQLTTRSTKALAAGPQRLSLPEVGLQQVSFSGGGTRFQLDVVPGQGLPLAKPMVSADGKNLIITFAAPPQAAMQTMRPNLNQPGAIPQSVYAPPLQPRAVAPPVGDMAVGTMVIRNSSFINLTGPNIVELNFLNTPAKTALQGLARLGGYGFLYIGETAQSAAPTAQPSSQLNSNSAPQAVAASGGDSGLNDPSPKVTAYFVNETFSKTFNSILLAAGLTARLEGRTIIVGKNIQGKTLGPRLSKVYRLNQVSPGSAADYLANLGASVTKTNTVSTSVSSGTSQSNAVQNAPSSSTTTSSSSTFVEAYGASTGPLLGLQATTDSRLNTITLIGDAALVGIAEQYLRQLDLRQRQVALSVKILDVTLENNETLENSFALRSGNTFILNDRGSLSAVFGSMAPNGTNPGAAYPNNQFLNQFSALIRSSSSKILASPTLILSENSESLGDSGSSSGGASGGSASGGSSSSSSAGVSSVTGGSIGRTNANEGYITVGETVVTGYSANTTQTSVTCTPQFTTAGLRFGAKINKIDDNGYVTFAMSPEISAKVNGGEVPNCGPFFNIALRRLDTGVLRVRDGQTLVLTGVLNENILATVRKWPIVGDLPLIGQFFRANGTNRTKSELVIMVTPQILREEDSSDPYGYGYKPGSQDARQFLGGS